jgi:hypothetical protein
LEYLLQNGLGRNQPVPTQTIVDHLAANGHRMTLNQFQSTLLQETRSGALFIGSSNRGLFIIQDVDDVRATLEFYENRVRAEREHMERLRQLAEQRQWNL